MYRTDFDLIVCIGVIKDFSSVALLLDTGTDMHGM